MKPTDRKIAEEQPQYTDPASQYLWDTPWLNMNRLDARQSIRWLRRRGKFPDNNFQTPQSPQDGDFYYDDNDDQIKVYSINKKTLVRKRYPEKVQNIGATVSNMQDWVDEEVQQYLVPVDWKTYLILFEISRDVGVGTREVKLIVNDGVDNIVRQNEIWPDFETIVTGSSNIPVIWGGGGTVTVPVYGNGQVSQKRFIEWSIIIENLQENNIVKLVWYQDSWWVLWYRSRLEVLRIN